MPTHSQRREWEGSAPTTSPPRGGAARSSTRLVECLGHLLAGTAPPANRGGGARPGGTRRSCPASCRTRPTSARARRCRCVVRGANARLLGSRGRSSNRLAAELTRSGALFSSPWFSLPPHPPRTRVNSVNSTTAARPHRDRARSAAASPSVPIRLAPRSVRTHRGRGARVERSMRARSSQTGGALEQECVDECLGQVAAELALDDVELLGQQPGWSAGGAGSFEPVRAAPTWSPCVVAGEHHPEAAEQERAFGVAERVVVGGGSGRRSLPCSDVRRPRVSVARVRGVVRGYCAPMRGQEQGGVERGVVGGALPASRRMDGIERTCRRGCGSASAVQRAACAGPGAAADRAEAGRADQPAVCPLGGARAPRCRRRVRALREAMASAAISAARHAVGVEAVVARGRGE